MSAPNPYPESNESAHRRSVSAANLVIFGLACMVAGFMIFALQSAPLLKPRYDLDAKRNLRQVARATLIYQVDYDDRAPIAANWSDAITPYLVLIGKHPSLLAAPEEPKGPQSVAFMLKLSATSVGAIKVPEKQTLLFETTDRRVNSANDFTHVWWRAERNTAVAFADGSVKSYRETDPGRPVAGTGLAP